jgi:hypothetical protein
MVCTANVSLTQEDLEADAVNITAYARARDVDSTGQVVTAVAQQPVQLRLSPDLQLDLDVLADSCVVKASNASGQEGFLSKHVACCPAVCCSTSLLQAVP